MLDTLGNVGDFLGGIGVVVTLIYLAGQIRQNTRSVRIAAFQAAQRDVGEKLDSLSEDPELIRLFFDGNRDFESLSKEDRRRYSTFMLRRYETLLYHTRHGYIESDQWEGPLNELRNMFGYRGTRAWWAGAKRSFNPELRDFVDQEILNSAAETPSA